MKCCTVTLKLAGMLAKNAKNAKIGSVLRVLALDAQVGRCLCVRTVNRLLTESVDTTKLLIELVL